MNANRYELIRELGRGAMGSVHLARQTELDRDVAIKRVLGAARDAGAAAEGLQTEARLLARLSHPNVVRVYELLTVGEDVLVVMEYVPGVDLRRLVAGDPPTPAVAIGYVEQLAAALDHAHERGLVHRDVKPANALIRPDGVLKLGDFGVAELRTRWSRGVAGRGPVGTPTYMAPESARGDTDVDRRADVYSLAVVAYELLAGRAPFSFDPADPWRTVRAQAEDPPPTTDLPKPVETAVLRGLEKRPERRPRSAGDFAAGLRAALEEAGAADRTVLATIADDELTMRVPVGQDDERTVRRPPAAPDETTRPTRPPSRPGVGRAAPPRWRPGRGTALAAVGLAVAAAVLLLAPRVAGRLVPGAAPPPRLEVTAVSATVQPQGGVGHCPEATYTFRATMTTGGGPGTLTYRWLQPDGQFSPPQSTTVAAGARQATATLLFRFSGSGSTRGVAALHVTSPIDAYSPPVAVTYACP